MFNLFKTSKIPPYIPFSGRLSQCLCGCQAHFAGYIFVNIYHCLSWLACLLYSASCFQYRYADYSRYYQVCEFIADNY